MQKKCIPEVCSFVIVSADEQIMKRIEKQDTIFLETEQIDVSSGDNISIRQVWKGENNQKILFLFNS